MQGSVSASAISVDEDALTATVAAGVSQRTLLKYLDALKARLHPAALDA